MILSIINKTSVVAVLAVTGCTALSISVGLQQGLAHGLKEFGWWALVGAFVWWVTRD